MSRVSRHSTAVNFQFTISETREVSLADVRVKVQNPVVRIGYNETAPFQSVGLAFASLPDMSSRENVSIHTLDHYPTANRPGIFTEEFFTAPSFTSDVGKFFITDMFIKKATGIDVALYFEHQIPITTDLYIQSGSDIRILDKNFDPVDPAEYLVWEGSTYWSVFHNFKHEYEGVTGSYEAYYISYPLWDSSRITQREHVELLRPTPRFRVAVGDDYDESLALPEDEPLYEVQNVGDAFLVTIAYDIVTYSPMNDIYGSPTPYIYAYRPRTLHEIGPLFPANISQEDPWFPLLTHGNFFAPSTGGNEYLIAEYSQQPFIPYEPYKREVYEETIILEKTLIKTQKGNLYVDATAGFHLDLLIFDRDENIKWAISTDTTKEYYVDAVGEVTNIPYDHEGFESVNLEDGLIQINYSLVALDDIILADYYYVEEDFEYTQINMNPIYNPDIAQKTVILFLAPYIGQSVTVYHLILDEEDNIEDSNAVPGAVAIGEDGNLSHGSILVGRGYTGAYDVTFYVEITQSNSVPGDITDAKYRYRQGASGAWTSSAFMTEDWITLGLGVQIKFLPGTGGQDFYAGDSWTIDIESNDVGLTEDIFGISYQSFLDTYCLPNNVDPGLLVVARYSIGSNRGIHDLGLVDTRVRGGGISPDQLAEARQVYTDINWMFDIGHYDGYPFPGSTSVLIDLPASLLKINGGDFTREEIQSIAKHHLALGVYPVIRFYCTNTGLVSHETVPDETYAWNWVVPEDSKCPTPDGEVICEYQYVTTTTSTTTTTTSASTTSSSSTTTTTLYGEFLEAFDNTYWEDDASFLGGHFTWTGTEWEQLASPRTGQLLAIGGWYVGYRPYKARITFSGPATVDWELRSSVGDIIGQATGYTSGTWVALDFSAGNDIAELEFSWSGAGLTIPPLTIQFFRIVTTSSTTTSTTSSTSSTTTTTMTSTTSSTASTSSTSSTTGTTASTSSSSSSTTTTAFITGPIGDCSVFYEPFLGNKGNPPNPTYWNEYDGSSMIAVYNDTLEKYAWAQGANAAAQTTFGLTGDLDVMVKINISQMNITVNGISNDQYFGMRCAQYKSNWAVALMTQYGDPTPYIQLRIQGNSPQYVARPDLIGAVPFDLYFRLRRVGTVWTGWYWNPTLSRWEWDGDPAGYSFDSGSAPDIDYVYLEVHDGQGSKGENAWLGHFDDFCIEVGTLV